MELEYIVYDVIVIMASLMSGFGVYFSYHILLNRSRTTSIKMIKEVNEDIKNFYDDFLRIPRSFQIFLLLFVIIPVSFYILSNLLQYRIVSVIHPFLSLLLLLLSYAAEVIALFVLIAPHEINKGGKTTRMDRLERVRFMVRKYTPGIISFIILSSSAVFYKYFTLEEHVSPTASLYLVPYFHVYFITQDVSAYTSPLGYALIYALLLSLFMVILALVVPIKLGGKGRLKWSFLHYENRLYKFCPYNKRKNTEITAWLAGNEKNDKVTGEITKTDQFLVLTNMNVVYALKWDQIVAFSSPDHSTPSDSKAPADNRSN